MKYLIDWNKVRNDVDIEEYFLFKMGNMYQFDKYKQAYVYHENGKSGDIIRFFRHEKSRIKMYYSIMNQDSGDIIQFIKKRVINNSSALPEEINDEIRSFVGSSVFADRKERANNDNHSKITDHPAQKYEVYGNIIQKIDIHKEYLEEYRKISPEAYLSEEFKGVLFTYTDNITSLSFCLHNVSGDRVGINRIYTGKGDYFNKKWFDANSKNSEGFTFSNKPTFTETLSIFESVFDAISFHEIYKQKNIQYLSSNGELSFKKAKNIKTYFDKHKYRSLILGNDNDVQGEYFNLNVTANFIESIKSVKKNPNLVFLQIAPDEKVNLLRQFFRRLEHFPVDFKDDNLDMNYYEDDDENLVFITAAKKESIRFFVGLLLKIWNLEKTISVYTPINKDFNEDLIKSKTQADE